MRASVSATTELERTPKLQPSPMQCRGRLAHVVVKFRKSADDDNDDDGGCPALDVWTMIWLVCRIRHGNRIWSHHARATSHPGLIHYLSVKLEKRCKSNQIKERQGSHHSCTPALQTFVHQVRSVGQARFVIAPSDLIRIGWKNELGGSFLTGRL